MDIYEAVRRRGSVRKYKSKEIPEEILYRILSAMRAAPSACDNQPWRFVLVTDESIRSELAKACRGQSFVGAAPAVLVAGGLPEVAYQGMAGGGDSLRVDVATAIAHLMLAAAAEGVGTCWVGAFDEDGAKRAVGAPSAARIVALVPMGYPVDGAEFEKAAGRKEKRLPLDQIVAKEKWGFKK